MSPITTFDSSYLNIFLRLQINSDKDSLLLEEMLNDVEAIAQLDWLWSSKLRENLVTPASTYNNVVEMAQVQHFNNVDGCDNTLNNDNDYLQQNTKYQQESHASKIKIKPIER